MHFSLFKVFNLKHSMLCNCGNKKIQKGMECVMSREKNAVYG